MKRASLGLRLCVAVFAVVFAVVVSTAAAAQDAVGLTAQGRGDYVRITLTWPNAAGDADLNPRAEVVNGVAILRVDRAMALELEDLTEALPRLVAAARIDPDGRTLRIALTAEARAHVSRSFNVVALDLVRPESPDPPDIVSDRQVQETRAAEEAEVLAAEEAARAAIPPPRLPLQVRVAQAAEYARIVFDWTEPVAFDLVETPRGVEVRFERDAAPNLARLRVDPPNGVTTVEARHDGDRLQVEFVLDPEMTARAWSDGARVIVDVMESSASTDSVEQLAALAIALRAESGASPPPPTQSSGSEPNEAEAPEGAESRAAAASVTTEPELDPFEDIPLTHTRALDASGDVEAFTRDPFEGVEQEDREPPPAVANPVPQSGVVRAAVAPVGGDVHVTFAWDAPIGAAAFRRGDAVWLVFDAAADLDLAEIRRSGMRHFDSADALRGPGYAAARLGVPASIQVSVLRDGASWTFQFSEAAAAPPRPAGIERRGDEFTAPYLFAALPTVTAVHAVPDAEAGDTLNVVTALGPAQGLPARRTFLEITALPSSHGLGFERAADGVHFRVAEGEGVAIERDQTSYVAEVETPWDAEFEGAEEQIDPGLIDFAGWSAPSTEFFAHHNELAREIATGPDPEAARFELAQLLIGQELGHDALGVLRVALEENPRLLNDPRFRALRGVANTLAGRFKDAERDLNVEELAESRAASLWRGYVATQFSDWREARRQFEEGGDALDELRSDWRGRMLVASANAALELNDLAGAKRFIDEAYAEEIPPEVRLDAQLAEVRYDAASGELRRAINLAERISRAGYEPQEVAALYELVRLRQQLGEITPAEAVEELENLRYRWRGDAIELAVVRVLGDMYLEAGDYRRGMQVMSSAASRFSEAQDARILYSDMSAAFREMFLDGEADNLDPIEALALWYEFNDLTPIGADGDRMLRRLADRLIDFDLLPQAAELLAHQVDNRLRGVARAQVATDLATIYLLDQRPEDALNALRATRVSGTPDELVAERRLLEARALADVKRYD
ncbi:MAG: hypothetical protein PVI23_05485, partial [Maricaulaceae bacterium]